MKYDSIFNRDFYPTPRKVLDLMELDVNNRIILEPSAGKGDIIDYCKEFGAKEVLFCEINKDLAKICQSKGTQIGTDFLQLKRQDVAGINSIIMNPPFSEFKKHFLHAWEIAPEGCEVVCLCNNNYLGYTSTEITKLIENYGYSQNLGNVFEDAERSTNTEIGLIKVYKPIVSESINFDDYFDEIDTDVDVQGYGLVKYNEIDSLINTYKGIIKVSENLFKDAGLLKKMGEGINLYFEFVIGVRISDIEVNKQQFLKLVQEQMWRKVFYMFNIEKYITSGVMNDIKAWIDRKGNTPFTKRNIFKMIEIIYGTKEHNFKRGLIEAVDYFTKHTKENRYNLEGWVTNSGHLLNKKIIVPYMCEENFRGDALRIRSYHYSEHFNDLVKAICNITGKNFDNIKKLEPYEDFKRGIWYDVEFFQYKGFKKGTMHFKFKDDKIWEMVNRAYAEAKGKVLPERI